MSRRIDIFAFAFGSALLAIANTLLGTTAAAASGPDPTRVFLQSISYDGSGCPQGSVGQSISDDRRTFVLIFDSFIASTGPSVPATERLKNCDVTLYLFVPAGQGLVAVRSESRGYVQLTVGGKSEEDVRVRARHVPQGPFEFDVKGPVAADYKNPAEFAARLCGQAGADGIVPVTVTWQVKIRPSKTSQQMTNDSIDAQLYSIAFPQKRCGTEHADDAFGGD